MENILELLDSLEEYSQKQEVLRAKIRAKKYFDEVIPLAIEQHNLVHFGITNETYLDKLWNLLTAEDFYIMPSKSNKKITYKRTIAHHIWHTTRIEDIVSNLLIAEEEEILNDEYLKKLNVSIRDTGNAMTDIEIVEFSKNININELKNYRKAVAEKTTAILKTLEPEDLKKRAKPESLEKIIETGGLTLDKKSYWLKDFWGKKTYAGLILLPLTRHHVMHLKDAINLKLEINE